MYVPLGSECFSRQGMMEYDARPGPSNPTGVAQKSTRARFHSFLSFPFFPKPPEGACPFRLTVKTQPSTEFYVEQLFRCYEISILLNSLRKRGA